jgi:hypothetical protein
MVPRSDNYQARPSRSDLLNQSLRLQRTHDGIVYGARPDRTRGGEGGTETRRAKQGGRQQSRWRPFSRFGAPCYARRMPAIEKTIRDIYREGLFARALGRLAERNPYPLGSKERDSWLEGWGLIDEPNDYRSPEGNVGEE